ncbi:MAG: family tricarboxylate transporter, receptor protein [Hyphomicrobiales bacterium]|nr:family tricarboxylate transporter, receptor protein [Hyphomicrobiales bacterium]
MVKAAWHKLLPACLVATMMAGAPPPLRAETGDDFYKGKTVTLVVGYSAGGGFDVYARGFAKFVRNHIPGASGVVVQNMPGAGSLTATNYIANVAPKDGTVFALARAPVMELLAGTPSSAFDPLKLTWIGNGATDLTVCGVMNNPNVRTMADAQAIPFTLAGLGPGSDEDMFTKVLNALFNTKARLVNGYPAGAEAMLAVERGEVDGRCGWSYSSLTTAKPEWVTSHRVKFLVALTVERSPKLPDTPSIMELATTDRQRQILGLVVGSQIMGRPFFAPPGLPADRVKALRAAFEKTMTDPGFLADRKALNEDVNPTNAEDVEALLRKSFATPRELVNETKTIIAGR